MNYSRQHLYALGEPLGESATRKVAGRIIYGFGGGGGGPTSSTVTQTNIPDWLRPQVETVLGAGMKEMFQTSPGEEGKIDITGVKPFKPFSENPSEYVAGFSPLQQQAFGATGNLQVPGQFMEGSGMAQQSGMGGFGAAQQAAGLAGMQAGAGGQYMGMTTNPFATQAFMSPYMQNVVNVQQQQAQRQADIANQAANAGFAQRGAFGGGRQGIAQAQANADLMRQKQDIQAKGLQSAFDQARQAQQFGADLNLRGLAGAQQGMSNVLSGLDLLGRQGTNLANIGTQQLGAQKDIIGLQSQMGAQQRQRDQDIINQDIQTFTQRQENPLNRLNAFNALLRGYAVPGQTTTSYQAAPPMASQLAGLGMGAYGVSKMFAEGGEVRDDGMATGGIASLNRKALFDPSVTYDQVRQGVKNGTISDLIGVPVMGEKQEMAQRMQAAQPAPQQPPIKQSLLTAPAPQGIDALPSNLAMGMAKGGIVAFNGEDEEGSLVSSDSAGLPEKLAQLLGDSPGQPKVYSALASMYPGLIKNILDFSPKDLTPEEALKHRAAYIKQAQEVAGPSPYEAYRKQIAGLTDNRDTEKEKGAAFLQAGAAMMQPGMSFAQGLGQAGSVLGQRYAQIAKEDTAAKRARAQMEFNLLDAERKERMGLHRDATSALEQARKDRAESNKSELAKRRMIAGLVSQGMTATKPTATGGGRPAQVKLPEQLAAAEIAFANNPSPENQRNVEALRSAVTQTRTSDIGPGRVGAAAFPAEINREAKIQAEYKDVMMGLTFHPLMPDYRDAQKALSSTKPGTTERDQASKEVMRIQKAIRASIEAEYPTAPAAASAPAAAKPTPAPAAGQSPLPNLTPGMDRVTKPDIKQVKGAPPGATIGAYTDKGWEIVNASGKPIGYVGE